MFINLLPDPQVQLKGQVLTGDIGEQPFWRLPMSYLFPPHKSEHP